MHFIKNEVLWGGKAVRGLPGARGCLLLVWLCGFAGAQGPFMIDPQRPPEQVTGNIQVWGWNIAAASLNKLVPAFNRIHPHVVVNVNMTGTNLQSRFLLSLSAGVGAPDVSQLQCREAPRYAITGKLTDLTAVARRYEKDFAPSFWQSCVHEGRIYAIPWDMGPCAVFYKRSVFARYGIDPETIETWDDYIAAGKRLLERSAGKTKMLFLPPGQMSDMFELLIQQNGGQLFDDAGRIAINSRQTLQAIEVLQKMLEAGIGSDAGTGTHATLAALKSDMVATYPTAAWYGGTIRDYAPETSGDWGLFRLPAMEPGGLRTSNLGGSVLVIPDQCARKEAAWAFIEYTLCTPEAQIEQYRNFDLFPALITTHTDPFFDEPAPFFGGQKVRRLFCRDIGKIPPLNRTTDWFEALRYVAQALSKWATEGMKESPQELLARLEEKLCRRLGRAIAPPGQ